MVYHLLVNNSNKGEGRGAYYKLSSPEKGGAYLRGGLNRGFMVSSFLSYFKTPSIVLAPGIEPVTSCFVVKCSTNCSSPDLVRTNRRQFITLIWHLFCTKSSLPSSFPIIVIAHLSLCRVDILDRLETRKNLHSGFVTHC